MDNHASGTFDVKLSPQGPEDKSSGTKLGRMSLDKQFHGDLEASSTGEMLTAMTEIEGSAGYVAIERICGTLHGRKGSFVLQHSGMLTRGTPLLAVVVVSDSGSDELRGICGTMTIKIADKKHYYEFDYTLGETH
ncbi:MAG: hypothetical protein JWR16_2887 [Nevskia sp.]|nr:hypothetical protein [Nevskia sp.]